MTVVRNDEKFSTDEIADLRSDLMRSGLDSWQAAELVASFLAARGYGVSSEGARHVASRLDSAHFTVDVMRDELERVAMVM